MRIPRLSLRPHSAGALALLALCALAACGQGKSAPQNAQETPPPAALQPTVQRTLLYPGASETLLTALPVQLPATGDDQRDMAALVTRYLEGPVGDGQVQPFLEHSALRALYLLDGGRVVLDLTGPVRSGGGSDTETARVYGLVDTLAMNFPAVKSVRILVDGQEVETLLGHLDLERPIPPEPRMLAAGLRAQLGGGGDGQP